MTDFVKLIVTIALTLDSIWGHNPILTPEKKKILGITMPRPSEVRHTTILPQASEDLIYPEEFNSSSTLESPKPPLLQTQWFPGEGILPPICNKQLNANISAKSVVSINGTVTISMVTSNPISAVFVVNRINQAKLISGSFTIGVRVIQIIDMEKLGEIVLDEIDYLQNCVEHPIGIFVDGDLYRDITKVIEDLDYNIWPVKSNRKLSFQRYSLLMQQLPWNDKLGSVEIRPDDDVETFRDFIGAVVQEQICLMHFKSPSTLYVLLNHDTIKTFKEEGHVFVISEGNMEEGFMKDLPNNTYIFYESPIEISNTDLSNSNNSQIIDNDKPILISHVLSMARPLIDLTQQIDNALKTKCKQIQGSFYLETCIAFLEFTKTWEPASFIPSRYMDVIETLGLHDFKQQMNFEVAKSVIDGEELMRSTQPLISQNLISNLSTRYYHYNKGSSNKSLKFGEIYKCVSSDPNHPYFFYGESVMHWGLKGEIWVAAGLTSSTLGIIVTLAILVFIIVRISVGDVFEGNPIGSILLLLSLVLLFASFLPFAIEYTSDHRNSQITFQDTQILNTFCAVKVFLVTLCYSITFSIVLCRSIMLASIGSEGGFLSHVNGYIQTIICVFSTLVQLGLSTQLLIVMKLSTENIGESMRCDNILHGNWMWGLLAYDWVLLLFWVGLIPFIYKSQRNYREGILLVIGAVLCFIIWVTWTVLCQLGYEWREASIPLGAQSIGWALLVGILIPRTFFIVRGIERSDMAQALPSLTSLSFGQTNTQYTASEQSVYECVNPAMRSQDSGMCEMEASEAPTLPLRGGNNTNRRPIGFIAHSNVPPPPNKQKQKQARKQRMMDSPRSSQTSLDLTPPADTEANNKVTRF